MRRRKNPDALTYWLTFGALLAGAAALGAYKVMSARERERVFPLGAGKNDVAIGGGWTMLDVSTRSSAPPLAKRANLRGGDLITVLLNGGAKEINWPYPVTVVGPSHQRDLVYAGVWALNPPIFGPQTIDFGPEHVFTIV
jgi:hypothetical protein